EIRSEQEKKRHFTMLQSQKWKKRKFNSIFEISTIDRDDYYILFADLSDSRINSNRFYVQWPYQEKDTEKFYYRKSFLPGNLVYKSIRYTITPVFVPFDILSIPVLIFLWIS
ncbi:MAG: hypothetical protein AAF518_01670, partial [Spirochaetota bacterium]